MLPVVVLVVGLAGLALAFRRWRSGGPVAASDADRELVAQARAGGRERRDAAARPGRPGARWRSSATSSCGRSHDLEREHDAGDVDDDRLPDPQGRLHGPRRPHDPGHRGARRRGSPPPARPARGGGWSSPSPSWRPSRWSPGVLVAQAAGRRGAGDPITGRHPRDHPRQAGRGRHARPASGGTTRRSSCTTRCWRTSPSNVEALTFKGWFQCGTSGDAARRWSRLDRGRRARPGLPRHRTPSSPWCSSSSAAPTTRQAASSTGSTPSTRPAEHRDLIEPTSATRAWSTTTTTTTPPADCDRPGRGAISRSATAIASVRVDLGGGDVAGPDPLAALAGEHPGRGLGHTSGSSNSHAGGPTSRSSSGITSPWLHSTTVVGVGGQLGADDGEGLAGPGALGQRVVDLDRRGRARSASGSKVWTQRRSPGSLDAAGRSRRRPAGRRWRRPGGGPCR